MPSKTEDTRIRIMQMGATYFMIVTKSFLDLNLPPSSTSSSTHFVLTTYPMQMQVRNATTGIITLLEIKSKNVRKSMPIIFIPDHKPLPREDGIPRRREIPNVTKTALIRLI